MDIGCSNCGVNRAFKYSATNVNKLIALGWNSYGAVLYCPKCVETWRDRNGDRELAGRENTIRVIDSIAERQGVI